MNLKLGISQLVPYQGNWAPGSLEHIAYKCVESNYMLLSNTSCTRTPIWIYYSLLLRIRPGLYSGPARCLLWVLLGITELLAHLSCHYWLLSY